MKRVWIAVSAVLLSLVGIAAWAQSALVTETDFQTEALVLTTSTEIKPAKLARRSGIEIQNLGPNNIFCALNEAAVLNKSRKIASGSAWGIELGPHSRVYCIAATAAQTTGGGTIVTETRR